MAKQLLIYGEATPVSDRHKDWSVRAGKDYSFSKDINSVPLTAVEFAPAAADFPIVFAGQGDQIMPMAIMGMRAGQNMYVDDTGAFTASYVPAFLRRYPFIFSSADDGKNFTLCIDESFEGCNQENRGERLFDSDGERTQYLNTVLGFHKEYQVQFARTEGFCKKLQELELLEPMGAQVVPEGGERITLTGFQTVNRQKLKELAPDQIESLFRSDGLELIHLHLYSLSSFNRMLKRFGAGSAPAQSNGVDTHEPLTVNED